MKGAAPCTPWISNDITQWEPLTRKEFLIKVKGGTVVVSQAEVHPNAYIVKSGRVMLSYYTSSGEEKIYMFVKKGGMFGETACFAPTSEFFYASALVNCELYRIPADVLLTCLGRDAALNLRVCKSLANKVHILAEHIARLSFLDAQGRVAAVFVDLAAEYAQAAGASIKIDLPVNQQDIADLVGTSPTTVGKIIRRFEKDKIIEKTGNRFYIYQLEELRRLASIK